ncbi:YqaA family protein [Ursidibacter sp. B-7004-1]
MLDYLISFFGIFSSTQNQLLIMFVSAFLSATILPGNSEITFTAFVYQLVMSEASIFSHKIAMLFLIATLGNSLGSLTTYFMARLIPPPHLTEKSKPSVKWALIYSQKYGVWVLLFSWLPIVGDLFCGIAGWLRFNFWQAVCLISVGKAIRYLILLWSINAFLS